MSISWLSISWLGVGDWSSVVDLGDWGSISNWGSVHFGDSDGWCLSVYNSVESIDWVSGVGDGSDGTIGLNKGVLALDNISITSFLVVLGITSQTVLDGVSVVVLWMSIVGLSGNSLDDCCWCGVCDWGSVVDLGDGWGCVVCNCWGSCVMVSNWSSGVSRGQRSAWGGGGETQKGKDDDCLDHDETN